MLGANLCRVYAIIVLLGGALSLSAVVAKIPAFDPNARQPAVDGSWVVADRIAHYDRGQYLYHLAYAYLNQPEFTFDETDGDLVLLDPLELIERTEKAEALLAESITHDPSNGHIWAAVAQAKVNLGKFDEMRASLKRSWNLAPNNRQLAVYRLGLVSEFLEYSTGSSDELDADELASVRRDIETLRMFEPDELESLFELSPAARTLLDS